MSKAKMNDKFATLSRRIEEGFQNMAMSWVNCTGNKKIDEVAVIETLFAVGGDGVVVVGGGGGGFVGGIAVVDVVVGGDGGDGDGDGVNQQSFCL